MIWTYESTQLNMRLSCY